VHGPVSEHCPIAGDARDPQAGGLLGQNAILGRVSPVWQSHRERIGHNHVLRGGPERSIGLSPVAPHTLSHPRGIDVRTDSIDRSSAIAVRDDPRMRHGRALPARTLLHITRAQPRHLDLNPNLTNPRLHIGHLADDQRLSCGTTMLGDADRDRARDHGQAPTHAGEHQRV
jgi:hypothetical protein